MIKTDKFGKRKCYNFIFFFIFQNFDHENTLRSLIDRECGIVGGSVKASKTNSQRGGVGIVEGVGKIWKI